MERLVALAYSNRSSPSMRAISPEVVGAMTVLVPRVPVEPLPGPNEAPHHLLVKRRTPAQCERLLGQLLTKAGQRMNKKEQNRRKEQVRAHAKRGAVPDQLWETLGRVANLLAVGNERELARQFRLCPGSTGAEQRTKEQVIAR